MIIDPEPGILEVKVHDGHNARDWTPEAPAYVLDQIRHGLLVTGLPFGDYAGWIGLSKAFRTAPQGIVEPWDMDEIDRTLELYGKFIDAMNTGEPPEPTARDKQVGTTSLPVNGKHSIHIDGEWVRLDAAYVSLDGEYSRLDESRETFRNKVRRLMEKEKATEAVLPHGARWLYPMKKDGSGRAGLTRKPA